MSDDGAGASPLHEYSRRRAEHEAELEGLKRRDALLSNARLAVFVLGLVIGWFVFGSHRIDWPWLLPPAIIFVPLLIAHDRVIQARKRKERGAQFYRAGIARLEDRWKGEGDGGSEFLDPRHPYAQDLDLFGEGSLFELVCLARSAAGRSTLARWLSEPAGVAEIRARQAAVLELAPRLDLREELALIGEDLESRLDPDVLRRWGVAPAQLRHQRGLQITAALLSTITIGALVIWPLLGAGPIPFLLALIPQLGFAAALRSRIKPVLDGLEHPTRDLVLLRDLLVRIEEETLESERLRELQRALETEGLPPSRRIAQLRRMADLHDSRRNQFFAPIAGLLLCGTQLALAVERWREHFGPRLPEWIEAAGEIEALAAISGNAFENPDHVMPTIREEPVGIEARALGHPLLPRDQCVRNDLELGAERRAYIVSGSNMSGKSTFLRALGCNVVLALAGAPVRAESLHLSPLTIAAAIRVNDSLMEGISHFYAEIKRLRQVVELCDGDLPVLFLLDEILHGTNSHDRRIGASAVIKELVRREALGLVTTHDLALAQIANEARSGIENVHFEDHLEDGKMVFDYQLRQGVVEKSNALELMRAVGLDV